MLGAGRDAHERFAVVGALRGQVDAGRVEAEAGTAEQHDIAPGGFGDGLVEEAALAP